MAQIALFHSVLGVRPGVHSAADLLRSHGHEVTIVDQYDGKVFDDYETASAFATGIGYPALMQRALDSVADLPDELVAAGFSNGGGMAQFVTMSRPGVRAALLLSGVIDPAELGLDTWPAGVPAQVHYTVDDPFRNAAWLEAGIDAIKRSGSELEQFDYPGAGHLFTDPSLLDEYQPGDAGVLWRRVLAFLDGLG